jgi:hypothetical protein
VPARVELLGEQLGGLTAFGRSAHLDRRIAALRSHAQAERRALRDLEVVAQAARRAQHERLALGVAERDVLNQRAVRRQRFVDRRGCRCRSSRRGLLGGARGGRRAGGQHAQVVERHGHVLAVDLAGRSEAHQHLVLTGLHHLGGHVDVLNAVLAGGSELHDRDALAVDEQLQVLRADRLHPQPQPLRARGERQVHARGARRVRVGGVAVDAVLAEAGAPVADRVLVASGRAEVDEQAALVDVGEVREVEQVEVRAHAVRRAGLIGRDRCRRRLEARLGAGLRGLRGFARRVLATAQPTAQRKQRNRWQRVQPRSIQPLDHLDLLRLGLASHRDRHLSAPQTLRPRGRTAFGAQYNAPIGLSRSHRSRAGREPCLVHRLKRAQWPSTTRVSPARMTT